MGVGTVRGNGGRVAQALLLAAPRLISALARIGMSADAAGTSAHATGDRVR